MDLQDVVSKYPPRKILMLPITIAVIAFIILGANYLSTGSPIKLGVEFTGGAVVTVPAVESQETITQKLAAYPITDFRSVGSQVHGSIRVHERIRLHQSRQAGQLSV